MSVSILIPTYNRSKFSSLISFNIQSQSYPLIKEIIIADDGQNKLTLDTSIQITVYILKLIE